MLPVSSCFTRFILGILGLKSISHTLKCNINQLNKHVIIITTISNKCYAIQGELFNKIYYNCIQIYTNKVTMFTMAYLTLI